jgi:hypothetical protein
MDAELVRDFRNRLHTSTTSKPTLALNPAVCTLRFLLPPVCCHPFTGNSLNHRLRSGARYTAPVARTGTGRRGRCACQPARSPAKSNQAAASSQLQQQSGQPGGIDSSVHAHAPTGRAAQRQGRCRAQCADAHWQQTETGRRALDAASPVFDTLHADLAISRSRQNACIDRPVLRQWATRSSQVDAGIR